MKNKILLHFLIFCFQISVVFAQENKTFTGKVTEIGETGLGPLMFVTLKNDKGEEFSINYMPEDASPETNKKYAVTYKIKKEPLVIGIRLMSETFEVGKNIVAGYEKESNIKLQGKYISGEQGDMGKYIQMKDKKGKTLNFLGAFEADIDNSKKYKNKDIEIVYVEEQEKELVSMKVVK